jgi:hypothetical protein
MSNQTNISLHEQMNIDINKVPCDSNRGIILEAAHAYFCSRLHWVPPTLPSARQALS